MRATSRQRLKGNNAMTSFMTVTVFWVILFVYGMVQIAVGYWLRGRSEQRKAWTPPPFVPHEPGADFLTHLRAVNSQRWTVWSLGEPRDPLYCANELGGEAGEVLNVVKKLVREQRGWAGSRATVVDLGEEMGDVLICLDTLATAYGIDLASATASKFNKTSMQRQLPHVLSWQPRVERSNTPDVEGKN